MLRIDKVLNTVKMSWPPNKLPNVNYSKWDTFWNDDDEDEETAIESLQFTDEMKIFTEMCKLALNRQDLKSFEREEDCALVNDLKELFIKFKDGKYPHAFNNYVALHPLHTLNRTDTNVVTGAESNRNVTGAESNPNKCIHFGKHNSFCCDNSVTAKPSPTESRQFQVEKSVVTQAASLICQAEEDFVCANELLQHDTFKAQKSLLLQQASEKCIKGIAILHLTRGVAALPKTHDLVLLSSTLSTEMCGLRCRKEFEDTSLACASELESLGNVFDSMQWRTPLCIRARYPFDKDGPVDTTTLPLLAFKECQLGTAFARTEKFIGLCKALLHCIAKDYQPLHLGMKNYFICIAKDKSFGQDFSFKIANHTDSESD